MSDILDQVKQAASKEPKTPEQQFLKLSEEVGEAAQAFLSAQAISGNGYKGKHVADVQEELVDVLLVTLAILYKLDTTDARLQTLLQQKVAKWLAKQGH
ncbi:MAG: MazG-like family protein [Lactobacillus sp.]|jgi:NTP pyrophosphatase (non-canonical NTP hydrolase)|nr:MazG-like family protein [Lactobacillus sp.]